MANSFAALAGGILRISTVPKEGGGRVFVLPVKRKTLPFGALERFRLDLA